MVKTSEARALSNEKLGMFRKEKRGNLTDEETRFVGRDDTTNFEIGEESNWISGTIEVGRADRINKSDEVLLSQRRAEIAQSVLFFYQSK